MAAEVSSLALYLNGAAQENSSASALKTLDLLGGGPAKIDSEELDLDLQVPAGWEKRLDLTSGKVYIQRCGASNSPSHQRNQAELQDLNSPPKLSLNLLEEPSLDLKLVSSMPSTSLSSLSLPFNYQSVCTLDKVKLALKRAERDPISKRRSPFWRSLQSPSCSSSSSGNREPSQDQDNPEKLSSLSDSSPVATGCPSCLAYVMVSKSNPKCPRCSSSVPLLKRARIDLNISI
ncbi:hypothetical protein SAY86_010499 [Trapa natans]|uniref:GIR1-like zinc ribbon domain-containing protein n=1 Tax=Trapa natans TaxID=22666 RepID=A0AAN7LW35_TRANT|nr:hypothetical protein SAY86_010499 [Trapa natans]